MMTTRPRRSRRAAVLLACALIALVLSVLSIAGPSSADAAGVTGAAGAAGAAGAQQNPAPQSSGLSSLADCAAQRARLAVVFLIDQSGSLRETDPTKQRVAATKGALTALAQVADRTSASAGALRIDVSLLGFGVGTQEVVPWTSLNGQQLPGLLQATDQFAQRDDQIDTDYAAALSGARDELNNLPQSDVPACRAILWFTDGQYDIQARSTGETKAYAPDIALHTPADAEALKAAGTKFLCDAGGLVDSLRGNGTELFAVALSSPSSPIPPEDQDFLRAVSEGTSGTAHCGTPPAAGSSVGGYLGTGDVGDLVGAFFQVVDNLQGGTPLPPRDGTTACPGQPCDAGTRPFVVDPGVATVSILALPTAPVDVVIRSPEAAGAPLTIAAGDAGGTARLGAASLQWSRVGTNALLVDITLPSGTGPWVGNWSLTFVDPGGGSGTQVSTRMYVVADVAPFLDPAQFRAGDANTLSAGVRQHDGTPIGPSSFASLTLDAVVADPVSGARDAVTLSAVDANGRSTGTWRAPDSGFSATLDVTVTAHVTTRSGIELAPIARTTKIDLLPPAAYPTVLPTRARFPLVSGAKTGGGVLTVRSGESAGGCVWVESTAVRSAPQQAGTVRVDVQPHAVDEASCLRVELGQVRELRITVTPSSQASGQVDGEVRLVLISDTAPTQVHTAITWELPLQRARDTGRAIAIFLAFMVVGFAAPLALMWLLGGALARFESPSELSVARIRVTVTASNIVYRAGRSPADGLALAPVDFRPVDDSATDRAIDIDDLELRTRRPRHPFGSPVAEAYGPSGRMGSFPPVTIGTKPAAVRVRTGLAGIGVVIVDEDELDKAPVGLAATIAMALGETPGSAGPADHALPAGSAFGEGRRPDLDVTLLAFAPTSDVDRYLRFFDEHRGDIAAIAEALYARHQRAGSESRI